MLLSFDFLGGVTFQVALEFRKSMRAMSWTISKESAGGSSSVASNVVRAFCFEEEKNPVGMVGAYDQPPKNPPPAANVTVPVRGASYIADWDSLPQNISLAEIGSETCLALSSGYCPDLPVVSYTPLAHA